MVRVNNLILWLVTGIYCSVVLVINVPQVLPHSMLSTFLRNSITFTNLNYYPVRQKHCTLFIFSITLSNHVLYP